jgi:hypothetical protein
LADDFAHMRAIVFPGDKRRPQLPHRFELTGRYAWWIRLG